MKYFIIIFITTLFLFAACKNNTSDRQVNTSVLEFSPKNLYVCKTIDAELICDSIKHIPLETNNNILIGNINDARFTGKYIVVQSNHTLYVFDDNGKFLNTIGKRGRGPGEYIAQRSFFITKDDKVIIFDPVLTKLHIYSLQDQFIESIDIQNASIITLPDGKPIDAMIQQIYPLSDSLFFMSYYISKFITISYATYNRYTKELKTISQLEHPIDMKSYRARYSSYPVSICNNEILCLKPFDNTIYHLLNDTLNPLYKIKPIAENEMPQNYLSQQDHKTYDQIYHDVLENKYIMPCDIMASENNLIITNIFGGKIRHLFWNKNSREGFYAEINSNTNEKLPFLFVSSMQDDICVNYRNATQIKEMCEIKTKLNTPPTGRLKALNEQIDENDNPIITLNYLKKNWNINNIVQNK